MPGHVRVASNLPTRQVDRLQARTHLLDSHVAGQRAERVDPLHVVQLVPEDFGTTPSQRVLLDDGALQREDVRRGVLAPGVLPAGVGFPIALDLFGWSRRADV